MKHSIVAASLLLVGGILVSSSVAQAAPQKAKAMAPKTESAWAAGTLEKFDPSTHTLVVKHAGKDVTFTLGDQAGVMRGKQKATLPDLTSAIGKAVKVEYAMANGVKTVSLVELPPSATHAPSSGAKPSRK